MRKFLFLMQLIIGASAVIGGLCLLTGNSLGMPSDWLEGSGLDSYAIPGLILFSVVGGSYLVSAIATLKSKSWMAEAASVAGFGLIIWVFAQLYIIKHTNWLQVVYLAIGIITIVAALVHLKYCQRKKS